MVKIIVVCIFLFGLAFSQEIVCPGGSYRCPQDSTCCKMSSGQYGCCPMPNAVCCNDHVHCCPEGYTCVDKEGACLKTAKKGLMSLYKSFRSDVKSIVCPEGVYVCPDSSTCCKVGEHEYGCCPLPNAVCCSDDVHCCPEGTQCDLVSERCTSKASNLYMPLLKKQKPVKVTVRKKNHQNMAAMISKENSVICPGGQYQCPEGNTCCKLPSGDWGCCPLLNAVCCEDHIHCCPQGTTCNVAKGGCDQSYDSIPWLKKAPATAVVME